MADQEENEDIVQEIEYKVIVGARGESQTFVADGKGYLRERNLDGNRTYVRYRYSKSQNCKVRGIVDTQTGLFRISRFFKIIIIFPDNTF